MLQYNGFQKTLYAIIESYTCYSMPTACSSNCSARVAASNVMWCSFHMYQCTFTKIIVLQGNNTHILFSMVKIELLTQYSRKTIWPLVVIICNIFYLNRYLLQLDSRWHCFQQGDPYWKQCHLRAKFYAYGNIWYCMNMWHFSL